MADADKRRNLKQQAITGEFNLQTDVGEICAPPARTASQTCGAYGRTPRDFNTFPVGPDCARPNSFTVADSARPHRNGAVPTGGGIPPRIPPSVSIRNPPTVHRRAEARCARARSLRWSGGALAPVQRKRAHWMTADVRAAPRRHRHSFACDRPAAAR